ncbi:uncharacterized protein [Solanum lycopersicum]|uniref:uncharacterized protein n=1 Tax=Solanum lycopersicum TaxID=4081 RepID=UPI000532FAF9|nr:uncharacterized protein LOC104648182 [Solanum lycopersicum]
MQRSKDVSTAKRGIKLCIRITVTHTGSVSILPNLTLKNVMYVPAFYSSKFDSEKCHVPLTRSIKAFGEVNEGLYLLKSSTISYQFVSNTNVVSILQGSSSIPSSFLFLQM